MYVCLYGNHRNILYQQTCHRFIKFLFSLYFFSIFNYPINVTCQKRKERNFCETSVITLCWEMSIHKIILPCCVVTRAKLPNQLNYISEGIHIPLVKQNCNVEMLPFIEESWNFINFLWMEAFSMSLFSKEMQIISHMCLSNFLTLSIFSETYT